MVELKQFCGFTFGVLIGIGEHPCRLHCSIGTPLLVTLGTMLAQHPACKSIDAI